MSRTVRLCLAVIPAALAAGGLAITLTITSDHVEPPVLAAVLGGLAGFSFIAAGLIARIRRPENRTGLLLMAVAFAWFAASLGASNESLVFTLGTAVSAIFAAFLVHLLLAYPTGRLRSRWERGIVVTGYVLAALGNVVLLPFDETPLTDCPECPSNAFLVQENDTVTGVLSSLIEFAALVLLLAVAATLALHWRWASPPARRLLSPVLLAGGISVFLLGLNVGTQSLWPSLADAFGFGALLASIATPYLFLWGILRSHLARAGVAPLMRTDYPLPDAQLEFRRILRDPTALLVVWLDERSGYIDAEGRPYELPPDSAERAVTEIADDEGPLGALVHDPALRDEELLADLTAALRLNLQRLRSTAALQASERRSRALLEALPDNMYRISRDGVYLDFHAQDPSQLRLPVKTLIGSTVWDYPAPQQTTEHLMASAERAFETGSVQTFEFQAELEDGTIRHREGRVSPSGPDEFLFITRDITDRKRAEEELRTSEQRSRALLEALPDAIYRVSREGTFLDFYSSDLTPLMDRDEIVGTNVYDYPIPRELMDRFMAAAEAAFETGTRQTLEYVLDDEHGVRYQEGRITPSGETEFVVVVRDVTDRKQQELDLERERDFVAKVVNLAPTYFCVIETTGRIVRYNNTLGETSGQLDDEIVRGRLFQEVFVLPEEASEFERVLGIANSGRDPGEFELRLRSKTGELLQVLWRGVDIRDETGGRSYLLCGLDITERTRQREEQAALRRVAVAVASEHRTEQVFAVVAEEIGRLLRASGAVLGRFSADGSAVDVVGSWSEEGRTMPDVGSRIQLVGGPVTTVYETRRPTQVEVDSLPPNLAERLREEGINSVVAAPITVAGRLWGAVSATLAPPHSFPPGSEHGIGGFTRLVSLALANAEAQRELAAQRARIVTAGDEERRRLERNLHDGAQQRLVSLSLSLRLAQSKLASDADGARELLANASAELALALEELRELARGIHPAVLTERGLRPALESLADRAPLPVELEEVPEQRLPQPVEAAAYYVVSEALTNVAKYAAASLVTVRVAQENGRAVIEVVDDGVGGADPARGSGLRGLTDRIEALDGHMAVLSTPGSGTRVRAEIPCG